jgi:hypothetical protein
MALGAAIVELGALITNPSKSKTPSQYFSLAIASSYSRESAKGSPALALVIDTGEPKVSSH